VTITLTWDATGSLTPIKPGVCPEPLENMKHISAFVLVFLIASSARAQHLPVPASPAGGRPAGFENARPAGKEHGGLFAIPRGVAGEVAATAKDFARFRDKQWEILTFAQIGAASADAGTTLYNLRHCATCQEIGVSRLVIGSRPDAHKYIIAGMIEITLEAVAGHYLRNHGPVRKWYWRYIWTLPQTFSLYEHAQGSMHNIGVNLGCGPLGQPCY
jgi:hypothetical protein